MKKFFILFTLIFATLGVAVSLAWASEPCPDTFTKGRRGDQTLQSDRSNQAGLQGPQGPKGEQGAPGPQGPRGKIVYVPRYKYVATPDGGLKKTVERIECKLLSVEQSQNEMRNELRDTGARLKSDIMAESDRRYQPKYVPTDSAERKSGMDPYAAWLLGTLMVVIGAISIVAISGSNIANKLIAQVNALKAMATAVLDKLHVEDGEDEVNLTITDAMGNTVSARRKPAKKAAQQIIVQQPQQRQEALPVGRCLVEVEVPTVKMIAVSSDPEIVYRKPDNQNTPK